MIYQVDMCKYSCIIIYSYLRGHKFSPEANVVILVIELQSASGVLPVERLDSARSSGEILKAIRRSYITNYIIVNLPTKPQLQNKFNKCVTEI
jgi:hypothetical protein